MWTCPACGRAFANPGQSHSCTARSVEEFLTSCSESAAELVRAVDRGLERIDALDPGEPLRRHAVATRLAWITRMTFASVTTARRWVDLALILPDWVDSPRVDRVDLYAEATWGHRIRLRTPADLDDELDGWLAHAWRRGRQDPAAPAPIGSAWDRATGDRLHCTFRGKASGGFVPLPRFLVRALGEVRPVRVRVGGAERVVEPVGWQVPVERGDGPVDVTIRLA